MQPEEIDASEMTSSEVPAHPRRKAGSMKGQIWMADDFDAPLHDFKDYI
jgi:hypothetical protein